MLSHVQALPLFGNSLPCPVDGLYNGLHSVSMF